MAKRQTRRAISVKGLTYQRLKKYCDTHNETCAKDDRLSIAGFVEELVLKKLDALGVPEETVLVSRPSKSRVPEEIVSSHFTF